MSLHPSWMLKVKRDSVATALPPLRVSVPTLCGAADPAQAWGRHSPCHLSLLTSDSPGCSESHVCIQELIWSKRRWAWGTKCLLLNSPTCSPLPRVQLLSGGERSSFWRQGRCCQQNPFTPHTQKVSKLSASGELL